MSNNQELYCSEHCIHYPACLWNGEYTPTPCRHFKDKADVVEVVHAEWVGTEYDGYADGYPVYDKWECSECHEEYNCDGEPPMFNYCPNCGAKMDGERSENDNS